MKFTLLLNKIIHFGVLAFVFLIPWQARLILAEGSLNESYWEYGTSSFYATEVILFFVLLALVLRGVFYIKKEKPKFSVKRVFGIAGAVFLLLAWSGFSVFWSIDNSLAFEKFIILIEASAVFLIIYSGAIDLRKIVLAVIFSGFAQALFAIAQFALQWIPESTYIGMSSQDASELGVSVVETDLRRWLRAYGTFPHPNILAGWLVLSLLLLISDLKRASQRFLDVFRYPILIILLFGLLATFSRSAWIGFLIFFIMFLFSLFISRAWLEGVKIFFVVSAVIAVFFITFQEPMATRLGIGGRLEQKSNSERMLSISQSAQIIKARPFTGFGIGNYGLAVHQKIDDSQKAWYYQPVHNIPLLIWSEIGFIGAVIVLLILLFVVISFIRPRFNFLGIALFVPLIVICLFDHYIWSLYPGMMIGAVWVGSVLKSHKSSGF
jgi:O-antigen ligase